MRRHAKAPATGIVQRQARGLGLLLALAASVTALLLVVSPAAAVTVETRPHVQSFDGSTSDAGAFEDLAGLAVIQGNGTTYAVDSRFDQGTSFLDKFDSLGVPQDFSAIGASSLDPGISGQGGEVAVDESGTATDGRIYVTDRSPSPQASVSAFAPDGTFLFSFAVGSAGSGGSAVPVIAVDVAGDLWIVPGGSHHRVVKYDSSGNPTGDVIDVPGEVVDVAVGPGNTVYTATASADIAGEGSGGGLVKFSSDGTFLEQLSPEYTLAVAIDKATGHVFALHQRHEGLSREPLDSIAEYSGSGNLVRLFGQALFSNAVHGLGSSPALAADGADRLLIALPPFGDVFPSEVHTFGGPTSVTVADGEVTGTSAISYYSATLEGTADPLGVPTEIRFQYRQEGSSRWLNGATQDLGSAAGAQAVSQSIGGLDDGSTYEFRIVATNTAAGVQVISNVLTFTTPVAPPPLAEIDPVAAIGQTSADFAGKVDPQGSPATYRFRYGAKEDLSDAKSTSQQSAGEGTGFTPVGASVTGLEPNTTYYVQLEATNGGGTTTTPIISFHTDPAPPFVNALPAAQVDATSAVLGASVNSRNATTTFYLEVSEDEAFSESIVLPPSEDAAAGSGGAFVTANQTIEGLEPNTTYYFRLIASNVAGTTTGETNSFTTRSTPIPPPAQGLPEGRVYERVSPADKQGAEIPPATQISYPFMTIFQAAPSGDAIAFSSEGNFDADGGPPMIQYIARRSPSGAWATTPVVPRTEPRAYLGGNLYPYRWMSDDLSLSVVTTRAALNPGDPAGEVVNIYLRNNLDGTYRLLTGDLPSPPPLDYSVVPVGAASSGATVAFSVGDIDRTGGGDLWLWTAVSLEEIGILPDGSKVPSYLGAFSGPDTTIGVNPISEDGSRVLFRPAVDDNGFRTPEAGLLMREFPAGSPLTIPVSVSERSGDDPDELKKARFEIASPDGSVVYLTSGSDLTDASTPGGGKTLYRWERNADPGERLTDLASGVLGTVGSSDDATSIYFVATAVLAAGARAGEPNLYRRSEVDGVDLVATLTPDDSDVWGHLRSQFSAQTPKGNEVFREARVSPDGRHLAFTSYAALTSYDTNDTKQVYLFDAVEQKLQCVSCGKVESSSTADSSLRSSVHEKAARFANNPDFDALPRNLAADGSWVVFDSNDALVPTDSNGVSDVYVWRDGRINLISKGSGANPSRFVDASADGRDIFFTTNDQLVPSDGDTLADLYDARIGGIKEPFVDPACIGDECQGTPSPPPPFRTPASAEFSGAGNVRPEKEAKRCRRGQRRGTAGGRTRCKARSKQHSSQKKSKRRTASTTRKDG